MAKVETVLVVREGHPDGKVLINKSKFDPKKHVLWSEDNKPVTKRKPYTRRSK